MESQRKSNSYKMLKIVIDSIPLVEQKLVDLQSDRLAKFQSFKDEFLDELRSYFQMIKRMMEEVVRSGAKIYGKDGKKLLSECGRSVGELASLLNDLETAARKKQRKPAESDSSSNRSSDDAELQKLTDHLIDLVNEYRSIKKQTEPNRIDLNLISDAFAESLKLINKVNELRDERIDTLKRLDTELSDHKKSSLTILMVKMVNGERIQNLEEQNLALINSDELVEMYQEHRSNRRELIDELRSSMDRTKLEAIEKRLDEIEQLEREIERIDDKFAKKMSEVQPIKDQMKNVNDRISKERSAAFKRLRQSAKNMNEKIQTRFNMKRQIHKHTIEIHLFKMAKLVDLEFAFKYQDIDDDRFRFIPYVMAMQLNIPTED